MSFVLRVGATYHHKAFGTERHIVAKRTGRREEMLADAPRIETEGDVVVLNSRLGGPRAHPDSQHPAEWPTDEFLAKWWPS